MGFIYKITNLVNGKIYIGQTARSVEVRWKEHLRHASDDSKHNMRLSYAICKYGANSFSVETIEECDNDVLNERECFWIKFYNSNDEDIGYNLTVGGMGTQKLDYEAIYALWDEGLGTGEISQNLRISQSNLVSILHDYKNYSREEGARRGYNRVRKTKGTPVSQYALSGEFICSYASSKEAARMVDGATHGMIRKACLTKERITSGGYQWRFQDDSPPAPYGGVISGRPRGVAQYDLSGNLVCVFKSISEAAKATSSNPSSISHCCSGRFKSSNNFKWSYIE